MLGTAIKVGTVQQWIIRYTTPTGSLTTGNSEHCDQVECPLKPVNRMVQLAYIRHKA